MRGGARIDGAEAKDGAAQKDLGGHMLGYKDDELEVRWEMAIERLKEQSRETIY